MGPEWVQNLDPWSAWAPPRMTISDPLKSTSPFRTLVHTSSGIRTVLSLPHLDILCTSAVKLTVQTSPFRALEFTEERQETHQAMR